MERSAESTVQGVSYIQLAEGKYLSWLNVCSLQWVQAAAQGFKLLLLIPVKQIVHEAEG